MSCYQTFFDAFTFNPALFGHLGGEEELWTTCPHSGQMIPASLRLFHAIEENGIRTELPVHQIELVTPVCPDILAFEQALISNRHRAQQLGQEHSFHLRTDPAPWCDFPVEVYPKPRYQQLLANIGPDRLRHGWIIGFHGHFGCASLGQAIQLMNQGREDLPLYLALAARSPVAFGVDKGRACERLFIYLQIQPDFVPPVIESEKHFATLALEHGFYEDPKSCWWGCRVNPVGTIEFRIFDVQEHPEHGAELVALMRVRQLMALTGELTPAGRPRETIMAELIAAASERALLQSYSSQVEQTLRFAFSQGLTAEAAYINRLMTRLFPAK